MYLVMIDSQTDLLLSVVVPVFNGGSFMPICLDSLKQAAQSLTKNQRANVEIIICDNHSNDGTFELANEFQCGCQVRVLRPPNHFENRTANWHHGLMHAQGRWMMMLHCDDRMAPEGQVGLYWRDWAKMASIASGRLSRTRLA